MCAQNTVKLCECGCGEPAPIASMTNTARGARAGQPLRFVRGHNGRRRFGDEFWDKVDKDGSDGCWIWTARLKPEGYGSYTSAGRDYYAHRVAYELLGGPIPTGLTLDHLCRNRACVNPAHLEPVTRGENVRRGLSGVLRTHCKRGHPFDEANTAYDRNGYRRCRACRRTQQAMRPTTAAGRQALVGQPGAWTFSSPVSVRSTG